MFVFNLPLNSLPVLLKQTINLNGHPYQIVELILNVFRSATLLMTNFCISIQASNIGTVTILYSYSYKFQQLCFLYKVGFKTLYP